MSISRKKVKKWYFIFLLAWPTFWGLTYFLEFDILSRPINMTSISFQHGTLHLQQVSVYKGEIHWSPPVRLGGLVDKSLDLYVKGPGFGSRAWHQVSTKKELSWQKVASVSVSRQTAVSLQCPCLPTCTDPLQPVKAMHLRLVKR